jgi:large subunit ribosomal protein L9
MKVLLSQDVEKLGYLGDIVEVSVGYARNFLLPRHIAIEASEKNIKSLAEEKARRSQERQLKRQQLEAAAKAVDNAQVIITAKTNEQGHLFGSVTGADIAANLRGQGFEVADDVVRLADHIKEIGTYDISLKFAADVAATVKVVVVSQDEAVETAQQSS